VVVALAPDPRRSYAVLIGASAFASADLAGLPAVAGNLTGLAEVLTDPALGAFPPGRCVVIADPASAEAADRALREYAARAEDTLLVYWAGHGGPGPAGELFLSVAGTDPAELPASALAISRVRDAMLGSPAAHRILILDCCLSGRAAPAGAVSEALSGQAAVEGAYALVSASPSAFHFSPPGTMYTALTGTLIGIMRNGMPDGPEFLTFGAIYGQLLYALASRGLSLPRQFGTAAAGQLALTRNPAYHRGQDDDGPWDTSPPPPRRAPRWRRLLTAAAVVAALGLSIALTNISQHQARPAPEAGSSQASAAAVDQMALSFPVSFTVRVSPAAVMAAATRPLAISRIMRRLDEQLAARRLRGRPVGLVQVFASGAITEIGPANRAAHLVLDSLLRRDPIFAKAAGQSFWTGTGDYFFFQIYFLT
jgi:caspase domain-containing protein